MDENLEFELIENFKHMAREAMTDAQKAHDLIFQDSKETIALAYLNSAISKFSALKALYYARYEILCHPEFDNVFMKFRIFHQEMLNNVCKNHSHQWTDIEFLKFEEAFDRSGISK